MSKKIVIIGGGIIGLSTAWYCRKRGCHVTVIDRQPRQRDGCSFGNAGMIVPSHFVPLAAPGIIRHGLKWLLDSESPFFIRPRASWDLLAWLWKFKKACQPQQVQRAAPLLRDLNLSSRQCFEQLQSELPQGFGLVKNGLMMLCRSPAALDEEAETAELAQRLGLEAKVLDAEGTARMNPGIEMDVLGSVYYQQDCHLSPHLLMSALECDLSRRGCDLRWQTEWTGFQIEGDRIRSVQTTAGPIDAEEVVICGGVWSPKISNQLGISIPMQAGKGYSLTLDQPRQQPSIASILTEARVAVTPLGQQLRFAGTMEIAGVDASITASRVRGIVHSIPQYFPRFRADDFTDCEPWVGLRPCSPDGLPYLGRTSRWANVLISTGHAMMGISLAAISGRIIAELVDQEPPSIPNLELLSPDRYLRPA